MTICSRKLDILSNAAKDLSKFCLESSSQVDFEVCNIRNEEEVNKVRYGLENGLVKLQNFLFSV